MNLRASIALTFAACLAVAPAIAKSAPEAAFKARAGKSRVVFECGQDKAIWLRVWHPARGWQGDRPAEVKIGDQTFKMQIDGATDSVLLSDQQLPAMGPHRPSSRRPKPARSWCSRASPPNRSPVRTAVFLCAARAPRSSASRRPARSSLVPTAPIGDEA